MGLRPSLLVHSVIEQFKTTNSIVPYLESEPGVGKSSLGREIGRAVMEMHGLPVIPYDSGNPDSAETANTVEFNGALRDPTDILGLPNTSGKYSYWTPPAEFYALRHGTGPKFLLLEEMSDSSIPMQNALCRVALDRYAGNLKLSDQLYILGTGNRTQDKSGAQRIVTKLANRIRRLKLDFNLDDFVAWAQGKGISNLFIQFARFRPNLILDFDPNRDINPTPRSWEAVTKIPTTMSDSEYFEHVKGEVNEGAAAEWIGFRRIAASLVRPEEVEMAPTRTVVPVEPAALYAMTGALAEYATRENLERIAQYVDRLPKEFQVMFYLDAQKTKPEVKMTKPFITWATKNASVLFS